MEIQLAKIGIDYGLSLHQELALVYEANLSTVETF